MSRIRAGLLSLLDEVGECLGGPGRLDPLLVLDGELELIVGKAQHVAVGVADQDDRGCRAQLADRERADLVRGDDAARVPDHRRPTLIGPRMV